VIEDAPPSWNVFDLPLQTLKPTLAGADRVTRIPTPTAERELEDGEAAQRCRSFDQATDRYADRSLMADGMRRAPAPRPTRGTSAGGALAAGPSLSTVDDSGSL
jgi:hypothetical protein